MTSRQPIRSPLRTRFIDRSVETNRLRSIAIAALIASTVSMAGCQQIGFRGRNDELKQMIAEQDDWALPQSSPSKVPRPTAFDLSGRKKSEQTKRPFDANNDSDPRESRQHLTQLDEPQTCDDENGVNIISTPDQELAVGADKSKWPPAARAILKQHEDFVKQKDIEGSSDGRANWEQNQSKNTLHKPTERPAADETKVVTSQPAKEKTSSKVTVRMTDTVEDDQNSMAIRGTSSGQNESLVVNAIANSQPTNITADPSGSQVKKASGVMPLPSIANQTQIPPAISNQELSTIPTASKIPWGQHVNLAIEQLEKKIKETPELDENLRISDEFKLRMLYLSQGKLDDASREIALLSDQEQEFFRHEFQALYEAGNPDAMPVRSRRWSLVMNSQREATNKLAAISNLEVKSAAFCTKVEGFGAITKFPKYQFVPDQELLLYCEVDNVAAIKVKDGYESQLQGSYEIVDSQGRKVADQLLPVEAEICQNHRRDYFIVYKIFMPQQIAAGNYQLRLMVEDSKVRKFGQCNLDFKIQK